MKTSLSILALVFFFSFSVLAQGQGPFPVPGGGGTNANQISGSGVVDWQPTTGVAATTFDATATNIINAQATAAAQGVVEAAIIS